MPNMPPHTKPDCTGQMFGQLTVLGRGEKARRGSRQYWAWRLQCSCGIVIELVRGDFDKVGGQRSCGCLGKKNRQALVDNRRRPSDITGQRFGLLTAIKLLPDRRNKKADWACLCDCGGCTNKNSQELWAGYRLNCGSDRHMPGSKYPETPDKLPGIAWVVVEKFFHLTNHPNPPVRDRRVDRLIRVAWILWFREYRLGEKLTDSYIARYMAKSLRFAPIDQFWDEKIEKHGGEVTDRCGKVRKKRSGYNRREKQIIIGSDVTNLTLPKYPVIQTSGKACIPKKRCYGVKTC